jgi:type I restriction enzyme S subunit
MSWEYVNLSEVAEFKNGVNFNKSSFGLGMKVINVGDFKDKLYPNYLTLPQINPDGVVKDSDLLNNGDILFVRSNGNKELVGRSMLIDKIEESITFSGFCIRCRFKSDKVHPLFYAYLFKSQIIRNTISNSANGTNITNLNQTLLNNLKVPKINISTQKRIASILSTYDDLIENNLKRIKLLEETAQNIYKEWFVNFRFPNYEHTEFDAESGLPVGWEKKSLNNFDCVYQFKEKAKHFIGEKEYLATANVEGIDISERGKYFSFDNRPSRAQHLAPQESVWFARMNKTYKVLLFTKSSNCDILLSSGFVGFVPKKSQFLPFLFCLINNKLFFDTKDLFCTGSTQVSLNNESINKLIYVEPNEEIISEFGNKAYLLIEQINKLFELNRKLKEARDILLPRLMNRTIEV